MTGYTDSYLDQYLVICEVAGFLQYGSEKSLGSGVDKMQFRKAYRESVVGVIPVTHTYDYEAVQTFAEEKRYPLMLKPTDICGSSCGILVQSLSQRWKFSCPMRNKDLI